MRQRWRSTLGIVASSVLLWSIWSSPAAANGRFPGATHLTLRGDHAVMASSFGVITSADRLATPIWACEGTLGYDPAENNDLGTGIFADGSIVISGPRGISLSSDVACTNPQPAGPVGSLWFADVTTDGQDPTSGLAVSRGPTSAADCAHGEVFESKDNGKSWASLGKLPVGFCPFTIDSAPSDKRRIYVSGNVVGPDGTKLIARLLRSDDRGATWTSFDIPNEARPFIGAVHPTDRDTLFVRTSNPPATGRLLVSTDGGQTYREIATLTGLALQFFGVTGIAVSPDGSKIAYGSVNEGLFIADGKGGSPEKHSSLPVMCLTWTNDGLYACSAPNLCAPFFVGLSKDEGRSFDTVLPTLDINADHTACAPQTPEAAACPGAWPVVRAKLGACAGDAGTPDAAADASVPAAPPPSSSNCDCDVVGAARASGASRAASRGAGLAPAALGVAVGLVALLRRRRRGSTATRR